jgi:hypothetical protein
VDQKDNFKIENDYYELAIDRKNGELKELYDRGDPGRTNLVLGFRKYSFGKLFKSKNNNFQFINLKLKKFLQNKSIEFIDKTGKNFLSYNFFEKFFEINFSIDGEKADRTGIELDFNFVNCPGSKNWKNQIIPTSPYWGSNSEDGFYLMSRPMGSYVVLVFSEPISCWRIKYSDFGHHLLGFQVLLKVGDLKFPNHKGLPSYNKSSIRIGFAKNLENAYLRINEIGHFPVVYSPFSGGIAKTNLPIKVIGNVDDLTLINPDKKEKSITSSLDKDGFATILMDRPGKYQIEVKYSEKKLIYSFFNANNWEKIIKKVAEFGTNYFQLKEGCFARAIDSNTLKYEGLKVIGGYSFGDPHEEHSCGSGEFGGFLCWTVLKRMLQFGETNKLKKSTKNYFLSWALQKGVKDKKYFPNAISPVEQEFMGYKFSPGHLYKEQLYIQYEGWFLEQFCDYFIFTKDKSRLTDIKLIAAHMINEHQDKNGALINISCHNRGIFQRVDYTTCATPVIGLIKAGKLLKREGFNVGEEILLGAEKACDHLVERGMKFPTETIPGVNFIDEGSIACTALTLIYAYIYLKQKIEYKKMAQVFLKLHDNWIIKTPLISLYGSSFRYWENSWETKDWGPSINGGHSWTIWASEAKYYNYFIERKFSDLIDSFSGFISNMPKVRDDGAIYSSFTPDYITGDFDHNGYKFKAKYLAHDFPKGTFVTSGSYFLIRASETWFYTSGLGHWKGKLIALNGILEKDSRFISQAPHFKKLAIEKEVGRINLDYTERLEIFKSRGLKYINIIKGKILFENQQKVIVESEDGKIVFNA